MRTRTLLGSGIAAVALAAPLLVGAGSAATAYPPGRAMTVSATTTTSKVVATVTRVQPGCNVQITARSDGNVSRTVTVSSSAGRARAVFTMPVNGYKVHVYSKTVGCASAEKASTAVKVPKAVVNGPHNAVKGQAVYFNVKQFPANATVTFRAEKNGQVITVTKTTTSTGYATAGFKLPSNGTWVITAVSGSTHASQTVLVKNATANAA